MTNKSGLIVSVVAGVIGTASAAIAKPVQNSKPIVGCDDNTREFVLTSDDPLYSCLNNELSNELQLQCEAVVSCMIEEGIVIDSNTISILSDKAPTKCDGSDQVPTICI